MWLSGKESACNGDPGSIPGWRRSPGGGNGNPLQYSCLKNPLDRGTGRLQSIASQTVGHDWSDLALTQHRLHLYSFPAFLLFLFCLSCFYLLCFMMGADWKEILGIDLLWWNMFIFTHFWPKERSPKFTLWTFAWLKLQGFKSRFFPPLIYFYWRMVDLQCC